MTRPFKLSTAEPVDPNSPLHWTRFWGDLQRNHKATIEARQDLVIWLANLHHAAINRAKPRAFSEVQVRLMDLRNMVRDYRPALDHFFEVKQQGYFIDEETFEVSTLIPKALPTQELKKVRETARSLRFEPPPQPDGGTVISKVILMDGISIKDITRKLLHEGRGELVPAVTWLLERGHNEINFHFKPSGKLKLRDTSVWPISGVETWPSWLREELFGPGIDLDAAYIQFLMQQVRETYADEPSLAQTLFPDLIRLLEDKEPFRRELCTKVIGIPYNKKGKDLVKRTIMSIANGSVISPTLLTNGSGFSLTAQIIVDAIPMAETSHLNEIGRRFQSIAAEFRRAKRIACLNEKKLPSRHNLKGIFRSYFAWERAARYALWEAVDRHGIMVHDGIDGIPERYRCNVDQIINQLQLRLTV